MTLYIKLNENIWRNDGILKDIRRYLPSRFITIGRPPSLATENLETRFKWKYTPDEAVFSKKVKAKLMGMAMESAIIFFFENFSYTLEERFFYKM